MLERLDLIGSSPLRSVRIRKCLPGTCIVRMFVDLAERLRDRRPTATGAEDGLNERREVEPTGANAEERKAHGEDDHHQCERPLRASPKPREEEGLLYRSRGDGPAATASAAASAGPSMARLALCAAAVNSCHSNPPFS